MTLELPAYPVYYPDDDEDTNLLERIRQLEHRIARVEELLEEDE